MHTHNSPHWGVGFLFLVLYPLLPSRPLLPHTLLHSLTHSLTRHHSLSHTHHTHSLTLRSHHSHTHTTLTHSFSHHITHTHLLRTIFANSDVECIIRAKHGPVKPDRISWMARSEKLCEGNLSTSLLDESNHSDAALSSFYWP